MLCRWSNNIKSRNLGSSGLSLDILEFIGEMFAILYFVAHVNGDDLEFVFGFTLHHDGPLENTLLVVVW